MNKKELKELKELKEAIANMQQNKYIYQRYIGIITKYIDNGDYYINCKTGIATKKDENLILGKASENIIDLIKVGDIVNGKEVLDIYEPIEIRVDSRYENFILVDDIKTILTKELYENNCFKVKEEQ